MIFIRACYAWQYKDLLWEQDNVWKKISNEHWEMRIEQWTLNIDKWIINFARQK